MTDKTPYTTDDTDQWTIYDTEQWIGSLIATYNISYFFTIKDRDLYFVTRNSDIYYVAKDRTVYLITDNG